MLLCCPLSPGSPGWGRYPRWSSMFCFVSFRHWHWTHFSAVPYPSPLHYTLLSFSTPVPIPSTLLHTIIPTQSSSSPSTLHRKRICISACLWCQKYYVIYIVDAIIINLRPYQRIEFQRLKIVPTSLSFLEYTQVESLIYCLTTQTRHILTKTDPNRHYITRSHAIVITALATFICG